MNTPAKPSKERRQLVALDTRGGSKKLFYLKEGEADLIREEARDGLFLCPVCYKPMIVRAGSFRDHFAHRAKQEKGYAHSPETLFHLEGKAMVESWIKSQYPGCLVQQEVTLENGRRPDVLLTLEDGERIAFEVQYSPINLQEWEDRERDYRELGVRVVWLWGHIPPHGKECHRDDRLAVWKLNAVLKACWGKYEKLFFVDPRAEQIIEAVSMADRNTLRSASSQWSQFRESRVPDDISAWNQELPYEFSYEDTYFIPQAYNTTACHLDLEAVSIKTPMCLPLGLAREVIEEADQLETKLIEVHDARRQNLRQEREYQISILTQESKRFERVPVDERNYWRQEPWLKKYLHRQHKEWIDFSKKVEKYYGGKVPGPLLWRTEYEEDHKMWLYHAHWKSLLWAMLEHHKGEKINFRRLLCRLDKTRTQNYSSGKQFAWSLEAIIDYLELLEDMGYLKLDDALSFIEMKGRYPRMRVEFNKPTIEVICGANDIP